MRARTEVVGATDQLGMRPVEVKDSHYRYQELDAYQRQKVLALDVKDIFFPVSTWPKPRQDDLVALHLGHNKSFLLMHFLYMNGMSPNNIKTLMLWYNGKWGITLEKNYVKEVHDYLKRVYANDADLLKYQYWDMILGRPSEPLELLPPERFQHGGTPFTWNPHTNRFEKT